MGAANRHLVATEPWKSKEMGPVATAAEALRIAAGMLLPVMPTRAAELLKRLGQAEPRCLADLEWGRGDWAVKLSKTAPLFPRVDADAYFAEAGP